MCKNECDFVLGDNCLNKDQYINNDECERMTRPALKHGTVFEADENEILEQLIIFVYKTEKEQLKTLRGILKAKLNCAVNKVSCVLKKISIRNLTELNNTMCAAAADVSELVKANKRPKA